DRETRVLAGDYRDQLNELGRSGECFDLIYLDPPWQISAKVANELETMIPDLLLESGVLVVESEEHESSQAWFQRSLTRVRCCQYGTSVISFYQHHTNITEF
ncbi:MAG TPA: RsmD family RNA methyltransferase, partial [Clostridia bacterium]|nr:RsmD family RNA methyltransferase [Clostridia bacterium]